MEETTMAVSSFSLLGHIIGDYHITTLLGTGRANAAYGGVHRVTQKAVIITILLLPEEATSETRRRFLQRFQHGAEALVALPHNQHLVPVRDFGEYNGLPYLVTEQTSSLSVALLLKQLGAASLKASLTILQQAADALISAHERGITHGNITPATLFLREGREIQVIGLGVREMVEASDLLPTTWEHRSLCNLWGTYLGDPRYLAPECVLGQRPDARSDLYALGLLLYELLRGTPAFSGSGKTYLDIAVQHVQYDFSFLKEELPVLPRAIDELLERLLARNPNDRVQRATDVVQACHALLQECDKPLVPPTENDSTSRNTRQIPGAQREIISLQLAREAHPADVSLDQMSNAQVRDLVNEIEAHIWDGYLLLPEPTQRRGWKTVMTFLMGGTHAEAY